MPRQELPILFEEFQYRFGPFCLRPDGTLLRDSAIVPLPPKELQLLRMLLCRAGQIVPVEQLRQGAWGEVHVSPDSLPRCISSLRTRLESEDCIQTIYKQGYRFNVAVQQTAVESHAESGNGRPVAQPRSLPRMAILPLAPGPGVPEFLGPGIAEETIFRLSRSRNSVAEIAARDSVFGLAGLGRSAVEIGRALQADLVLTGTITALPQAIRLRVELVRVSDSVQSWVEDFLVPRSQLASADTEVAKRIVSRIRNTFANPISPVPPPRKVTRGDAAASHSGEGWLGEARRGEAYALYLQSKSQWSTVQRHNMLEAIHGFQHVLELDGGMVSARLHLMHAYLAMSSFGYMRADLATELARKQAEIVLSTSGLGTSVYPALGWMYFFHDRDIEAAAAAFSHPRAPGSNPWATIYESRFALGQGRMGEAVRLLRAALVADPYSAPLNWRLTWALHLAGEQGSAIEQAKRSVALFPNDPGTLSFASIVFAASSDSSLDPTGDLAERAIALSVRLTQIAPSLDAGLATLAYAQARKGNIAEAMAILDRLPRLGPERFVMSSFHAPLLVELGEFDAALQTLSDADEHRCPWLFEMLGDPRLKPLHGNPEFQRLGDLSGRIFDDDASVA